MRPDEWIAYTDGYSRPVCGPCAASVDPLEGGTPCPDCFLIHSGDCF